MVFSNTTNDFESNKEQLLRGFKILNEQTDISKFFTDDDDDEELDRFFAYLYYFTQSNYDKENVVEIAEFFLENNFHIQLVRLNEYFVSVCETLGCDEDADYRRSSVLINVHSVCNFLFVYSRRFRLKFMENGGLKCQMKLLDSDILYKNFTGHHFFQKLLMNTSVLTYDCEFNKQEWTELNAVSVFFKLARLDPQLHFDAYSALLAVLNDDDIKKISEDELLKIIKLLLTPLNDAAKMLNAGGSLERGKKQFPDENDDSVSTTYDVLMIPDEINSNISTPLTTILNNLYKLAVNDKMKYDLYAKYNVRDGLRSVLFKGNEIEKRFAFQLLAQLCFDPLVLDAVSRDIELMAYMKAFSVDKSVKNKSAGNYCKQILWSLSLKSTTTAIDSSVEKASQIMISYNSASRDMCLKIKCELEKAGYKIWIDIDEIHGSSLDSMATAVEQSHIIIMCVTEGYRQSVNCQAEAQYAFKLKKPIVPLIMQKDYDKVGGWLGMIMGDRIHINFIKHTFPDAMSKLLSQIQLIKPNNETKKNVVLLKEEAKQPVKTQNILKWSEQEVLEWFQKSGNMTIYEELKPCDGELLDQLHQMRTDAPEFFYQFISKKNNISSRDILVFTKNLQKLFSNNE